MSVETGQRRLSAWTLAAIVMMPAVFSWLLLRKGYSGSLRRSVLVYATVMTAVGTIGQLAR